MRTASRLAALAGLLLVALVGLALALPFLKEGFAQEELPRFGIATVALIVVALWWWRGMRAARVIRAVGLVVLALPLTANVVLTATLCRSWLEARTATRSVRIVSVRESPIELLDVDGPVGLVLEIQLEHALPADGILYAPKLRLDGPDVPRASTYFSRLSPALVVSPFSQPSDPAPPSPAQLVYELYPDTVTIAAAGAWFCFDDAVLRTRPARRTEGDQLGATWMLARANGGTVDLSEPLTRALRAASAFQGKPDAWWRLVERLNPGTLAAAGFEKCAVQWKTSRIEGCYCAP